MLQHATGLGSATETLEETRSTRGIIRFTGAVKQWPPSVDMARPRVCPECGQPAFEGGRVRLYGHGLVRRQQRGPPAPGRTPATEVLLCRRYLCTGCDAVLTVLPPVLDGACETDDSSGTPRLFHCLCRGAQVRGVLPHVTGRLLPALFPEAPGGLMPLGSALLVAALLPAHPEHPDRLGRVRPTQPVGS